MSNIFCYRCLTETNEPGDEYPVEWKGLCPSCAVKSAIDGELPGRELAIQYLLHAAMNKLSADCGVTVIAVPISVGEILETPVGPIHYSPN